MNLSLPQTKHIAKLSKLNLSEGEIGKFRKQLSSILDYIELLNEVDTADVEPTAQTSGLKNVYQEDEPQTKSCLTQEEVLVNPPKSQDGFVRSDYH